LSSSIIAFVSFFYLCICLFLISLYLSLSSIFVFVYFFYLFISVFFSNSQKVPSGEDRHLEHSGQRLQYLTTSNLFSFFSILFNNFKSTLNDKIPKSNIIKLNSNFLSKFDYSFTRIITLYCIVIVYQPRILHII
jgi:hypothetical protein